MTEPTTCPACHTRYTAGGEPNCWCEPERPKETK